MRQWFISIICIAATITGCKKDTSIDPKLTGNWDDYNAVYSFRNDYTYSIHYYHYGYGKDTVKIDSVFGSYELNRKKNILYFFQKGYREKFTGNIVNHELNSNSWTYSFQGDTLLLYTSSTSTGSLKRK